MTKISEIQPDGLRLLATATISQLMEDDLLEQFAEGIVQTAFDYITIDEVAAIKLNQLLFQDIQAIRAFLAVLSVLDAEIEGTVSEKQRRLPLAGFLTYRDRLKEDTLSLNTVRLPPLNPDGHYLFVTLKNEIYLVVRLDLNPASNVAGHIRIAFSSPTHPTIRLNVTEERLDRKALTPELIDTAVTLGNEALDAPLTEGEQQTLVDTLNQLISNEQD
ncbi:MAG: hypothetical protein AAF485_18660 [Chloroflexota bacterium]